MTKSPSVTVAIVITSHQRPALLKRCLERLEKALEHASPQCTYEIHLGVDEGDTESLRIAEAAMNNPAERIAQVREQPLGASPSSRRNQLLKAVRTQWVFFLDDDAYLPSDYLVRLHRHLDRALPPDILGGPNLTPPGSSRFQQAVGAVLSSRLATFFSVSRYVPTGRARNGTESDLILCNLVIRRALLGDNPFFPNLLCAEENVLVHRLKAGGATALYDPELYVFHERRGDWRTLVRQVRLYGIGRGQMIRLYPESSRWAYWVPCLCTFYALLWPALFLTLLRSGSRGLLPSALPFVLYAFCCACFAVRSRRLFFRVVVLFPLIHVSFAFGLIRGLFHGQEAQGIWFNPWRSANFHFRQK